MPGLNEYQLAELLKETDPKVLEIAGKFNVPVPVAKAYLQAKNLPPVRVLAPHAPVPEDNVNFRGSYVPERDEDVRVIAPYAAEPGDNVLVRAEYAEGHDPEHPLAPLLNLFNKPGFKYDPDYASSLEPRKPPSWDQSVPRPEPPFKTDDDPETFEAKKRAGAAMASLLFRK